jgi:CDP-diglyceride synthetase
MWTTVFIILVLLATLDLGLLWQASRTGRPPLVLSSFTLACQAAFAILGAFHVGPLAFAGFSTSDAVMTGELAFLLLMCGGFVADVRAGRARTRAARHPPVGDPGR